MCGNVVTTIYLVDDDEDDRLVFAEVLSEIDPSIDLKLLQSGEELSQLLCKELAPVPDIIFLNVNMPVKNGFDCLKEIRNRKDNLRLLKIIMFSTSQNPDTINQSMQLGADYYAIKPASIFDLKSLFKKVLEIDWNLSGSDKIFTLN